MLDLLIVVITCTSNLLLGSIVLLRNPRLDSSRAFFSIGLWVSLWAASNYLTDLDGINLLWNQIANSTAYLTAFFAVASVAWFSYTFPVRMQVRRAWALALALGVGLLTAILSVTPLMAGNVSKNEGVLNFTVGPMLPLYVVEVLVLFALALRNLLRVYSHHKGKERQQVLYVLTGLSFPIILGLVTNAIIPSFTSSWQTAKFGPMLTIFLVGIIAVSIIRHQLFDLRLAVARSLAYILSIAAVVFVYVVLAFGISRVVFDFSLSLGQELLLAFFSATAAVLFQPVKRFFDRFTNTFFYRDAYSPQQLFNSFNEALVASVELEDLLNGATRVIATNLKADFCVVALATKNPLHPRTVGTINVSYERDDILKGRRLLREVGAKVVVTDYLEPGPLKSLLLKNQTAVMARLKDREELGYLLLGPKRSGNPYNSQDIHVIETLTDELIIAIQNSLRFEEIEKFNETLQQKIENATRKLRRTNEKLRMLDQTKDDFISMASHQLRTPLTSVKGYVSMVLDGDAGRLNAMQRKLLNQSFISAQRMVYLISDLLNVSRLRTGKFVIEPVPTNLARVIKDEVEQLQETAKGRNLELIFNKPEHFPTLNLDETKMRQVIMNFIDNAIYYTHSGGRITINLTDKPESIEFTVTDTGIGVPRHEQHHLFSKFFRAHNARRARPDGTGLGLFMAKKVIVAQGGAIIFRSQEGVGSTFGFTFSKDGLVTS